MDPLALIEDYLSDQENGMKTLITWFLNQVMLQEALQQREPSITSEPIPGRRIGTATRTESSRPDTGRRSSGNRSFGSSRLRHRSLDGMPGWRRLW